MHGCEHDQQCVQSIHHPLSTAGGRSNFHVPDTVFLILRQNYVTLISIPTYLDLGDSSNVVFEWARHLISIFVCDNVVTPACPRPLPLHHGRYAGISLLLCLGQHPSARIPEPVSEFETWPVSADLLPKPRR